MKGDALGSIFTVEEIKLIIVDISDRRIIQLFDIQRIKMRLIILILKIMDVFFIKKLENME